MEDNQDSDDVDYNLKCKTHPDYKGIRRPKRTKKFPKGCETCLKVYSLQEQLQSNIEWEREIWDEVSRLADKPD
jgi:hypothetical protein